MLTNELQATLQRALDDSLQRRHEYVQLEHVLLSLLKDATAVDILQHCGADLDCLCEKIEIYLKEEVESIEDNIEYEPEQTLAFQRMLQRAVTHVQSAGKDSLHAGNLLVSLLREEESYAVYLLAEQGITRFDIINYISHGISKESLEDLGTNIDDHDDGFIHKESIEHSFEQFTSDLMLQVEQGLIDPLIGRQKELDQIFEALMRRKKNNPLLLGEPGVGKTALAQGIAWKIYHGDVPKALNDLRIYSLNLGSILANAKYRGDFERCFKSVLECIAQDPLAVLFIDEIHTIIGAGSTQGNSFDASALIKAPLALGTLRCIGATTYKDYNNVFIKDRGLVRRFQTINVEEPTVEETEKILHGLKASYEKHHRIQFTKAAISSAVHLSARYLNDTFLPDKAIDLLDVTGAQAALSSTKKKWIKPKDIEQVVARMARIPAHSVSKKDKERLENLNKDLTSIIFGQDEVIASVVETIRLSRAGLGRKNHPIGCFLLAGPTGVGKTELAKQLAVVLNLNFVRYDMSEYMEKHSVSRLIGSPPGYVGFDQGGLLTNEIRKNPHTILLLDEIEKAHPDIANILLQIMDDASLMDNNGQRADFEHVILMMTTNEGSVQAATATIGFSENDQRQGKSNKAIENRFSPELRNRMDSILQFNPLEMSSIKKVARKFLDELEGQLQEKHVELIVSDKAYLWFAEHGYNASFGARPMIRLIQEQLKTPISNELLFGAIQKGGKVRVNVKNKTLTITYEDLKGNKIQSYKSK